MVDVVRTRTVAADVDEVWTALADFGAISRWAPNVDHSCLMSDRTEGIGTVRRIQTGRTTVVERVTEWEPGTALAYSIDGLPPILRSVVNRWTIEPVGGDTRVSLTSSVHAGPRPPRRLVARVVGRRLASASDEMLAGLDRHLTQRQGAVR